MSTTSKSKGSNPGPGRAPKAASPRAWRINPRALIALAVILVVVGGLAVATWLLQANRGRSTLLAQAKALAAANPPKDELALSYLKEYLASQPRDLEALDLRGEILARSAYTVEQLQEIIRLGDSYLRFEQIDKNKLTVSAKQKERNAKRALVVQRRMIDAMIKVAPAVPEESRRLGNAEAIAGDLADTTNSAADLRLHGLALSQLPETKDRNPLKEAAKRYEQARKLEPKDVSGSELLARIYILLKEPAKADAVIADLVQANPTAPAYIAAARFYAAVANDALNSGRSAEAPAARRRADDYLKQAIVADPKNLDVRLEAAQIALAAKRPAEAATHLDAVAEKDREDYRYLTLRGVVSLQENKADDAVESWSRGLSVTSGSEADLSWKLAYVLLQLGRVDQAEELINQFRRLVGNPTSSSSEIRPEVRFLEALKLIKKNNPTGAIAQLKLAKKMPPSLEAQTHLLYGNAAEAIRDMDTAIDEYNKAIAADPKFITPRLTRIRIFQADGRFDEAVAEVKKGLAELGEDPALITAAARLEYDRQRRLPPAQRSLVTLEGILKRGLEVAPASPALAVIRANAMALGGRDGGRPEAASDMLEQATAINKTDPELWLARAERLVALSRPDQALLILDQALQPKAAGDQASLRIYRAKLLTALGRGTEAREALIDQLDRVRPDQRPDLWRALGELYSAQGDAKSTREARKAFGKWAEALPDDPLPRLFVLELALSDPSPEAQAEAQASRTFLEKTIKGYYGLVGTATFLLRDPVGQEKESKADRQARLARAETLIDQIEADGPKLRYGPLLRGALLQKRGDAGDKVAAAKAYERALKLDGGITVLPRLVALYNEMGKAGQNDLERLRTLYPAAAQGIIRAEAENAARKGDNERAQELANQIIQGAGESLDAYIWQARLLNTLGKPEDAEKSLRALVDKHPETLGPWMALLYFQVSRKEQAAAVTTVEAMIAQVKELERPELVWGQAWRVAGDRDRADKAFDAALERWPADPRVGRAAAEYYTATDRAARAEKILRDALEQDETQRWAARGLALILSGRPGDPGSWQKAWNLIKDAPPGGDLPEDRLIRALVLSRGPESANREAALPLLAKLVDDLPSDLPVAVTARSYLIQSLIRSQPSKAADLAAVDARGANASATALSLHASALIAANQLDDADRQLDRLDLTAPGDGSTVTLRARLLRARGKSSEASEALVRAAPDKINGPDGETAGRIIVQTLIGELNDDAAALKVAEMLVAKYPHSLGVKAAVLARLGNLKEALKLHLEVIKDGDPAHIREAARNSLALITRDKFDPATIALAEKVIDAARQKDEKSSDLLAMAGYLRHYQNRYEDEIKIYEDALAKQPEDFTLMNNMAWTLSEGLNKPEQAFKVINEAIRKSVIVPPQFYDTRGCIYTRMGKYPEAIRDLELAVHGRDTGTTWAHLARAYQKDGQNAKYLEARDAARKAGLTADMLEKADRAELEPLIFGK
ncbi:MAG: Tetratricopeptide 1 repeat-containing protein [Actinomycetia bacterium]|nr:Tetratricopeptide 1 repeat-containing protein [Actinomycetes bacterium]